MKTKIVQQAPMKIGNPTARGKTYLCDTTPCGLFKDFDGNKYLITDHYVDEEDCVLGVAIALAHSDLPRFTWQVLGPEPLGRGRWYGPYRIRFVDALARECGMGHPGVITVGDRHASIQCTDKAGKCHMISLGYVGRKGLLFKDFDGWMIEMDDGSGVFCETATQASASLVLRPRVSKKGSSTINNIFKRLIKEGTIVKRLKAPNNTRYEYRHKNFEGQE